MTVRPSIMLAAKSETTHCNSTTTESAPLSLVTGVKAGGPSDSFTPKLSSNAKKLPTPVTLTVTSITRTGFNYDEVHGSIWGWPTPGVIGIANLDSQILTVATTGEATMYANPYGMTNDTGGALNQVKGLVLVP